MSEKTKDGWTLTHHRGWTPPATWLEREGPERIWLTAEHAGEHLEIEVEVEANGSGLRFALVPLDLLRELVDAASWRVVARDGQPTEEGVYLVTLRYGPRAPLRVECATWARGRWNIDDEIIAYRALPAPYVPGEEG